MAYRLILVTHEAVVRTFRLPLEVALTYSDERSWDSEGNTLLHAFLTALRMTPTEYARARAAYGPFHNATDHDNVQALRQVLEDP